MRRDDTDSRQSPVCENPEKNFGGNTESIPGRLLEGSPFKAAVELEGDGDI